MDMYRKNSRKFNSSSLRVMELWVIFVLFLTFFTFSAISGMNMSCFYDEKHNPLNI